MSKEDEEGRSELEKDFLEAMKDKTIALPIVAIRILCNVLSTSNARYVFFFFEKKSGLRYFDRFLFYFSMNSTMI